MLYLEMLHKLSMKHEYTSFELGVVYENIQVFGSSCSSSEHIEAFINNRCTCCIGCVCTAKKTAEENVSSESLAGVRGTERV